MIADVARDTQTEAILIVALERLRDPKTGNARAARAIEEALREIHHSPVIVDDDDGEI